MGFIFCSLEIFVAQSNMKKTKKNLIVDKLLFEQF